MTAVDVDLDAALEAAGLEDFEHQANPDLQVQAELGARLRQARKAAGLSLQGVEDKSGGTWKAVVVGSYERGDRAITIPRLVRYCAFLGVTIYDVLPMPEHVRDWLAKLEAEHAELQRRTAMRLGAQLLGYAAAWLEADAGDAAGTPQPPAGTPTADAVNAAAAALSSAVRRIGVVGGTERFTAVNLPAGSGPVR